MKIIEHTRHHAPGSQDSKERSSPHWKKYIHI